MADWDGLEENREFQEDFETPTHSVENASTERRPDAISLDYLTAHTVGPVARGDMSEGPVARAWRLRLADNDLLLAVEEEGGWGEEEVFLTITDGIPVLELDVAFEQNGQPIACMERPSGAAGESEIWIFFFDATVPEYVLRNRGPGRTPRAVLDRPLESTDSDVLVFYISDADGVIAYRQQRERYDLPYLTPFAADENTFLEDVAKRTDRRVLIIYSVRDPESGTYTLRNETTVLTPFILGAESLSAELSMDSAAIEVVVTLSPDMTTENITAVLALLGARLEQPLIELFVVPESVSASLLVAGMVLSSTLLEFDATTEQLMPAFSVLVLNNVLYITIDRVAETEEITASLIVQSAQLEVA